MMIKLKKLIPEFISHGVAINRSPNDKLIPTPLGQNDGSPNWDENGGNDTNSSNIVEGTKNDWFCNIGQNNWNTHRAKIEVCINENDDNKPQKIWIEIKTHGLKKKNHTHKLHEENVKKHIRKIASAWMSKAKKLHIPQLNEIGNPINVSWLDCFREAMKEPKIRSLIADNGESAICDPVNFTLRK